QPPGQAARPAGRAPAASLGRGRDPGGGAQPTAPLAGASLASGGGTGQSAVGCRGRTIRKTSHAVATASTAGVTPSLITGRSQPSPACSRTSAWRAARAPQP